MKTKELFPLPKSPPIKEGLFLTMSTNPKSPPGGKMLLFVTSMTVICFLAMLLFLKEGDQQSAFAESVKDLLLPVVSVIAFLWNVFK